MGLREILGFGAAGALGIGAIIGVVLFSFIILIFSGIISFAISLLIVKIVPPLLGISSVPVDALVVSAAILTAASMIASNRK